MNKNFRNLILLLSVGWISSGCSQSPLSECPRSLTEPPMPDLPPASGIYQGKLDANFVITESGRATDIAVDASDLRIDGEKVNQHAVEEYAIESLRARQFSSRPDSCKVTFSAWVN
jgi:hypothetical protein